MIFLIPFSEPTPPKTVFLNAAAAWNNEASSMITKPWKRITSWLEKAPNLFDHFTRHLIPNEIVPTDVPAGVDKVFPESALGNFLSTSVALMGGEQLVAEKIFLLNDNLAF